MACANRSSLFLLTVLAFLNISYLSNAQVVSGVDENGIATFSFGKSKVTEHIKEFFEKNCKTNPGPCVDKAIGDAKQITPNLRAAFASIPEDWKNYVAGQCASESWYIQEIWCWANALSHPNAKGNTDIENAVSHLWQAFNRHAGFSLMTAHLGYQKHPALFAALKNKSLFWVAPKSIAFVSTAVDPNAPIEVTIVGKKRAKQVKPKPDATPKAQSKSQAQPATPVASQEPPQTSPTQPQQQVTDASPQPESPAPVPKTTLASRLASANGKMSTALQSLRSGQNAAGGGANVLSTEALDALQALTNMTIGIQNVVETHGSIADPALGPALHSYLDTVIADLETLNKGATPLAKPELEKALEYFKLLRSADYNRLILEMELAQLPNSTMQQNFCPWFLELEKQAPSVTAEWASDETIRCKP